MSADHPALQIRRAPGIDPVSVQVANVVIDSAVAAGHPADPDAATAALRGPAAAAAVHRVLHGPDGPVEHAHAMDLVAAEHATSALQHATAARLSAAERQELPRDPVSMSDGPTLTRGDVAAGLRDRQRAAAHLEQRGDFEHRERPPSLVARVTCAAVLSTIDLFLLLVPVTNASLTEPLSLLYVAGLLVLLVLMNDSLPRATGRAFREHREQLHAVWDNVGPTAADVRGPDADRGRTAAGQADLRRLRHTGRRRTVWSLAFGALLLVYGSLVFSRVLSLAARLLTTTPLAANLAAALITACTIAAPAVLAWRWSRGNQLGDQLREYGGLDAESRALAADADQDARAAAAQARAAALAARRALMLADEDGARAVSAVSAGLQLASDRLGMPAVVGPDAENVLPVPRKARDHAVSLLDEGESELAAAEELLEKELFPTDEPAPDPWSARLHSRAGRAVPPAGWL